MKTKIIAFSCIAWALAGILSASPANAVIAIREADLNPHVPLGDHIMVSAATESISFDACAFHFYFEQQMTPEHGPSVRAYTDQMYSVGRKDLFLVAACDGWLLFEAGPCAC